MAEAKGHVRLLLIEDSADDAEIIKRILTRSGFSLHVRWVDDGPTLSRALEEEDFDLVISDYRLPSFDALAALALVRATDPDLPFIMVSGQVGEDAAVDAVRRGANDYLLKQNLTRLPLAVERELREAALRRDRTSYREQLVVSERMALIGTLASGLVHEINNPLGSMTVNLGYVAEGLELCRAAPPEKMDALLADLIEPIAQMKAACAMVGTIASDVRTFARSINARTGEAALAGGDGLGRAGGALLLPRAGPLRLGAGGGAPGQGRPRLPGPGVPQPVSQRRPRHSPRATR